MVFATSVADDVEFFSEEYGAPSAMAIGDTESHPDVLFCGTHGNSVAQMESPDEPPMAAALRGRPMVFGDQFTRKKAKRLTVLSTQRADTDIIAAVEADGREGTAHTLAFTANIGFEAQERRARVGGRGRQLQPAIYTAGANGEDAPEIRGILLEAQVLRDQT